MGMERKTRVVASTLCWMFAVIGLIAWLSSSTPSGNRSAALVFGLIALIAGIVVRFVPGKEGRR